MLYYSFLYPSVVLHYDKNFSTIRPGHGSEFYDLSLSLMEHIRSTQTVNALTSVVCVCHN